MTVAETPFNFFAVSSLTRIGNQSATIGELLQALRHCSDPIHLSPNIFSLTVSEPL